MIYFFKACPKVSGYLLLVDKKGKNLMKNYKPYTSSKKRYAVK